MKPRIFISSVSSELGTTRQLVANVLSRLGYDPVWQDIFGTESGDLRQVLRDKIDDCEGLIQLVGHGYGAEPPTASAEFEHDGFTRISYTQFEFLYARARGKKTWLIFADDGCTRDRAVDELDRSHDPNDPDPAGYQAERRALQDAWRERWKRDGHLFHGANSDTDVELKIERLRDEFAEMRQAFRWWQRSVTRNLVIVASLVLVSIGIGLYVSTQQRHLPETLKESTAEQVNQAQATIAERIDDAQAKTEQHVEKSLEKVEASIEKVAQVLANPAVLANRIRKEIHATAEAKIKALPDEKGRGRLIAEIEKERDLALGRVDDLIKLIQEGLKEGASPVFQRAAEILQKEGTDEALAYLESRSSSTLETAERQAKQVKQSQARVESEKEQLKRTLQAMVLNAELLETKLQWASALKLREKVAELAPDWFEARNDLGTLHCTLAQYLDAEPHQRAALALAANRQDKAVAMTNLAVLLQTTNRVAEAEPLMRHAMAIVEQSNGSEHPHFATQLNNLAWLLKATNRPLEAEPLMRRALTIDESVSGPFHSNVARDLNNLAQHLQDTNRLAEAENLMRRALAIDEKAYGPDHPNVGRDMNNLGRLLLNTNRLAIAEPLLFRALAVLEKSLDEEHPLFATALNNLAILLEDTNRLVEAEPLKRRALAIDEQSYGAEHPDVALKVNNLATLLYATNRLAEAEPLMRRAVAMYEKSLSDKHPLVAAALNNLAQLLQATDRLTEAEPLFFRQIVIDAIFSAKTGYEHPESRRDKEKYRKLCKLRNVSDDEIQRKIKVAMDTRSPLMAIVPEVDRLLGPAKPVADVLAALDRQYKAERKPDVYLLKPEQPIAPHLDELCKPNPASLNAVGVAAFRRGDHATAVAHYEESLKLLANKPDQAAIAFTTRMNRAAALRELGEVEPARDELRKLLSGLREGDAITPLAKGRARYRLALCEWRLNDRDAAQREAAESLKAYGDDKDSAAVKKQTEQLLADLKENKLLSPLTKVDATAALAQARAKLKAQADLAKLPVDQSALPLLDQMLGPAKSTKEVFEELDRQYREQNKPKVWFLPLSEPIAPHLDELLGPVPEQKKD